MFEANGSSETCAQKKGRCSTSEKRFEQSTRGSLSFGCAKYVERHVPCHVKSLGCDLPVAQHTAESRKSESTYSTNKARHNSSLLVNAYNARHVPPSRKRSGASKVSSNCMSNSSGKAARVPQAAFRLTLEVKAFPDGLTPRGCRMTRLLSPASPCSMTGMDSNL